MSEAIKVTACFDNPSELAHAMLEWEQKREELDELESKIKATVMRMEKTQTVGRVKAQYTKGRGKYDYAGAGEQVEKGIVDKYTEIVPETTKTDWRAVCKEAGVEVPYTPGTPSVSLKVVE